MATPTADAVIVAAGASTRMAGLDKMTADVGGRPLLAWTVSAFRRSGSVDRIAVVVARDRLGELGAADWLPPGVALVAGGQRRQESVAAGVAALDEGTAPDDRVVLVHDGARPFVPADLIERVIAAAAAHGAAIPAVPIVETLKRVDGERVVATVDRDGIAAAQTPQGIQLGVLRSAYDRFPPAGPRTFTDEAALLEACTIPVRVVPGSVDNIKVTVAPDLRRAASLLANDAPRVGTGEDSHPFGPGAPLVLGGVVVSGAPRLAGHSDGDVVLHAIANALLGGAGLGDLGRLFPADERTPDGVASSSLLGTARSMVESAGFDVGHLDVTIVGARPRLGSLLDEIRASVAALLGVAARQVSVKASTGNLFGAEGAGRGISARAIATLVPRR